MEPFEPSREFVAGTMRRVFLFERDRLDNREARAGQPLSRIVRWAISAGGVALGCFNLATLFFSVFSAVPCH